MYIAGSSLRGQIPTQLFQPAALVYMQVRERGPVHRVGAVVLYIVRGADMLRDLLFTLGTTSVPTAPGIL